MVINDQENNNQGVSSLLQESIVEQEQVAQPIQQEEVSQIMINQEQPSIVYEAKFEAEPEAEEQKIQESIQ